MPPTLNTLTLHLKGIYFDQIASGQKVDEYRLRSEHWRKRLEGRAYDQIIICRGYPSKDDTVRRINRPWRGYREITLTHEHFGPDPVEVFAIKVN